MNAPVPESRVDRPAAPRRLGVMGGTFDPIHVGHLVAAATVLESLALDRVVFVPTGQPWQKERYSDPEHRFAMTLLGAAADRRYAVSRMEIDRRGPTYTADTMAQLRDFYGGSVTLYFIAGADAVLRLGTWHGVERLSDTTTIVAVTRPGWDINRLSPQPGWPPIRRVRMPDVDVSATDIRRRVARGLPIDGLTPPPVIRYIRDNGLYRRP